MTKLLTQEIFKGAHGRVRSAAVDENGHAFMNNYLICRKSPHFREGRMSKSNNPKT